MTESSRNERDKGVIKREYGRQRGGEDSGIASFQGLSRYMGFLAMSTTGGGSSSIG